MADISQNEPPGPDQTLERALLDHGDMDRDALRRARRVCEETGDRLDPWPGTCICRWSPARTFPRRPSSKSG
jgi:hypothetical protein